MCAHSVEMEAVVGVKSPLVLPPQLVKAAVAFRFASQAAAALPAHQRVAGPQVLGLAAPTAPDPFPTRQAIPMLAVVDGGIVMEEALAQAAMLVKEPVK